MKILSRWLPLLNFRGSRAYWEARYRLGGNAGAGSLGDSARYKAGILNAFVRDYGILSIIEFGCGDGRQLALAEYPDYLGLDISPTALELCRKSFGNNPTMRFGLINSHANQSADLALSLDVIYHLVEDDIYNAYLDGLFASAKRFVIVYSSSTANPVKSFPHVRHRDVESDIARLFPSFRRMFVREGQLRAPAHDTHQPAPRFFLYERTKETSR